MIAINWSELQKPGKMCETCGVEGCVCEYCDQCGTNVNPYEHFLEWNPEGGLHISGVAMRGFERGVL